MTGGWRPGHRRQRPTRLRRRDSCDGEYVEIGEVAGWIAHSVLTEARALTGPMEAEHYASHLASMWESAGSVLGTVNAAAIGHGVVDRLVDADHPIVLPILRALAVVAEQPICDVAADRAASVSPDAAPSWVASIGEAKPARAGRVDDPTAADDGRIVLVDLLWPCGERGGLGVFIDSRGYAKHVLVGPTVDDCLDEIEDHERRRWPLEALSLGDAAAVIQTAVEATEADASLSVGDTFVSQRGFLRAQLRRLRGIADCAERAS
jgi:hypothetical protein